MKRPLSPTAPEGASASLKAGPLAAATLALLALASACAPYVAKPVDLNETARAYEARRLDDERVHAALAAARPEHAAPWPPLAWDRADLLLAAWALNPRLAERRAALETTRAALASSRARPEPTVGLLSEYSSQAAESSPWLLGFTLDLPLDAGERRAARIEGARLVVEQATYDAAEQLWSIRDELARALDDWSFAEREGALWKEILLDRSEERRLVARQIELGATARTELSRIETDSLADEQRALEGERRLAGARSRAARALGLPETALDSIAVAPLPFDASGVPDSDLERWRAEALLARSDIRGAVAGYAFAEQQLRLEIARQYPEVRLGPGYIWERGVVKLPFDIALSFPLFQRNRGPIAEAEARRAEAGAKLESAQAEAFAEVEGARAQSRLALAALDRARSGPIDSALRLERAAAAQAVAGELDRLGEIEPRLARRQAELAALAAEASARAARRDLESALRRPLDGPELALAEWLHSSAIAPPEEARP